MNHLAIALESSVIAAAFSLFRPGLFTFWFDLLLWIETKGKFGRWIAKPLGMCAMCLAGQIAFWWSFYASGWHLSAMPHILFSASAAILLAALLNKFHEWTKK